MSTKRLMRMTKDTVKLGMMSSVGMGVLGTIKGMSPPESGQAFNAASAGIGLANVGQTANIGMGLSKMLYLDGKKRKR